jgi:hypothetical protein
MSKFIANRPVINKPKFASDTSCPSGAFDTSARLDVQAAVIRNRTWAVGPALPTWGSDYAVPPEPRFDERDAPPEHPQD